MGYLVLDDITEESNKKKGFKNENCKKLFAKDKDTIAYFESSYRFLPRSCLSVR